jgi:hypothetical protein
MAPTQANLDGTCTEYFDVECSEATLLALLRACFEEHWSEVIFGPCLEGAVFEGRFSGKPVLTLFDGYATVDVPGEHSWHFHLCIGDNRGSSSLPTPPELARWRRCTRAAFFRNLDGQGSASAWGLRLWNGRGEQMLTVSFPNPWIDPARQQYVDEPNWSRLDLWMGLRERFADVPGEPPPALARRPVTH